jgi:sirohydrochlorin cobaltochelatase
MNTRTGLLLFAHGARDPRWASPFQEVARRARALQPGLPVQLAFLEFMSPTLPQACAELVAAGCTHIDVVPLFLGAGGHVRKDLPLLMDAARAEHPGLSVQLHASIGESERVVQAMAETAVAALAAAQADPA